MSDQVEMPCCNCGKPVEFKVVQCFDCAVPHDKIEDCTNMAREIYIVLISNASMSTDKLIGTTPENTMWPNTPKKLKNMAWEYAKAFYEADNE